jgi:drug/metabolite transporter (DMT)-like permease
MGIFFALLAAILASASNFCLRRSIDAGGASKAYLVVQLSFSFLVMILLNPVRTGDYSWSNTALLLGLIGGILLGFLMWGLGKTLEKGPPGLSFAVLNTSSVMPGVLLALLFGTAFNHPYTLSNGLGSILVVIGLFWAGWTSEKNPYKLVWILFATFIFSIHTIFLVFCSGGRCF